MGSRLGKLSGVMFLLSLVLPAHAVTEQPLLWGDPTDKLLWGVQCLMVGWFYWPGWLANPLMLVALIIYDHGSIDRGFYPLAAVFATMALVSAVIAPFLLAADHTMTLRYPHAGYFAWAGSMLVFAVACVVRAHTPAPVTEATA